jgi:hypothetical protein
MIEAVTSDKLAAPIGPFSPAIRMGEIEVVAWAGPAGAPR